MAAQLPQGNVQRDDEEGRPQREVAQRVFAAEYNASTFEYKEGGERSPTYVVTPLGAKVNRLFVVGVLTQNERVGTSGDMWKAQVLDPTGTFSVYAGQYQPEAASALSELTPPAVVAIVGKSRTYAPEPGVTYVSIRPETIKQVDVAERDRWVLEAARHTLARLEAMQKALELPEATEDAIAKAGVDRDLAEGVAKALETYGPPDAQRYAAMIRDALESLIPGMEPREPTPIPPAPSQAPDFAPAASAAPGPKPMPAAPQSAPAAAAKPAEPADPKAEEREELINALCEKLDDGKGAPWEEIVAEAGKSGISEEQVEESLNSLMDKGLIYEPVLGRLKRT